MQKNSQQRIARLISVTAITGIGIALGLASHLSPAATQSVSSDTLAAAFTRQAPAIDGQADALWRRARPLVIEVTGGPNTNKQTLRMRALYDQENIYLLCQWNDPTESLARFPWEKQPDGSWKQLATNKEDEQRFYEDKLAILWPINAPSFVRSGCMTACHVGDGGKPFGNMFAPKGELLDLWHWKSLRTNSVVQADDQYLDDTPWSKETPIAGRKSDPLTSGGYKDNLNQNKAAPAFMPADKRPAPPYWITSDAAIPFADVFKPGDRVAPVIVSQFVGDRGDLRANGVWKNGQWTLEIARRLVTGSQYDVQFQDLAAHYPFAPSIFDNASVRHAFTSRVYRLAFAR
ncbi:MAG: ethylbenzene dehydrogenase-related protein [Blastocatellia bacterium]